MFSSGSCRSSECPHSHSAMLYLLHIQGLEAAIVAPWLYHIPDYRRYIFPVNFCEICAFQFRLILLKEPSGSSSSILPFCFTSHPLRMICGQYTDSIINGRVLCG